jgi:nucleotide-binding universal stress UspA family protein
MVPTDFSAASDAALGYARTLAHDFGASIELVHVFDDPFKSGAFVGDGTVMMPVELRQSLETWSREQLAERHAQHSNALPRSTTVLLAGAPARRIVEHAKETQPDLIVMGTHGRSGLGHFLLGSVTERVVRTATCPVLTWREPASAASPSENPHRQTSEN